MKNKTKVTIKKVGLVILGLVAVSASIVGITKAVEYLKDDTKGIVLSYDVGGLNEVTGKFEESDLTLYTKNKFACFGLNATLDFDSTIKYQIFYYDILDNFISSTDVLSEGFNDPAPLNGAYARIEITPISDEDEKITFFEKNTYGSQLNVRVAKDAESKLKERYTSYKGKCLEVATAVGDLKFKLGESLNDFCEWIDSGNTTAVSLRLLAVNDNNTLSINTNKLTLGSQTLTYYIYCFNSLPTNGEIISIEKIKTNDSDLSIKLDKETKYVLINVESTEEMSSVFVETLSSSINLTKVK